MTNAVMVWLRREAALLPAATVAAYAGLGGAWLPFTAQPFTAQPASPR